MNRELSEKFQLVLIELTNGFLGKFPDFNPALARKEGGSRKNGCAGEYQDVEHDDRFDGRTLTPEESVCLQGAPTRSWIVLFSYTIIR
jgi:hypothetical protein